LETDLGGVGARFQRAGAVQVQHRAETLTMKKKLADLAAKAIHPSLADFPR